MNTMSWWGGMEWGSNGGQLLAIDTIPNSNAQFQS